MQQVRNRNRRDGTQGRNTGQRPLRDAFSHTWVRVALFSSLVSGSELLSTWMSILLAGPTVLGLVADPLWSGCASIGEPGWRPIGRRRRGAIPDAHSGTKGAPSAHDWLIPPLACNITPLGSTLRVLPIPSYSCYVRRWVRTCGPAGHLDRTVRELSRITRCHVDIQEATSLEGVLTGRQRRREDRYVCFPRNNNLWLTQDSCEPLSHCGMARVMSQLPSLSGEIMLGYWECRTKRGTFRIVPRAGSFNPFFEDEDLGAYHSAAAALDDLLEGLPVSRRVIAPAQQWQSPRSQLPRARCHPATDR